MEDENNILNDKRPISLVAFEGEDGGCYRTSAGYVIEAYPEAGQHCYLPWIRVIKNGEVICRIPAGMLSIHYEVAS